MERVCPLCNGLQQIDTCCPRCGYQLIDGGSLQNFFGPYSPYEEYNTYGGFTSFAKTNQCIHLLYCPACDFDQRTVIEQVVV